MNCCVRARVALCPAACRGGCRTRVDAGNRKAAAAADCADKIARSASGARLAHANRTFVSNACAPAGDGRNKRLVAADPRMHGRPRASTVGIATGRRAGKIRRMPLDRNGLAGRREDGATARKTGPCSRQAPRPRAAACASPACRRARRVGAGAAPRGQEDAPAAGGRREAVTQRAGIPIRRPVGAPPARPATKRPQPRRRASAVWWTTSCGGLEILTVLYIYRPGRPRLERLDIGNYPRFVR